MIQLQNFRINGVFGTCNLTINEEMELVIDVMLYPERYLKLEGVIHSVGAVEIAITNANSNAPNNSDFCVKCFGSYTATYTEEDELNPELYDELMKLLFPHLKETIDRTTTSLNVSPLNIDVNLILNSKRIINEEPNVLQ